MRLYVLAMACLLAPAAPLGAQAPAGEYAGQSGKELFQAACSACHGADGKGAPRVMVGFEQPLPDFTDCNFASREPESDWVSIVHSGGPVRGFSQIMPSFAEAFSGEEITRIVRHVRSLCTERAWPRGDLNLPRPMVIEKAFPEDELVMTTTIAAEGPGNVSNLFIYEKRFGARSQIELKAPITALRGTAGGWRGAVGDTEIGFKRAVFHTMRTGSLLTAGAEVVLPTGNRAFGAGNGVTVFEPYLAAAQILPSDGFLHFQGGFEVPRDRSRVPAEMFWRTAVGKSFFQDAGRGRAWSPMLEVLAARNLVPRTSTSWDLLPQMQVSLNKRQHLLASVGLRIPVTNAGPRTTQLMFYLLWDFFDGGLRDGW